MRISPAASAVVAKVTIACILGGLAGVSYAQSNAPDDPGLPNTDQPNGNVTHTSIDRGGQHAKVIRVETYEAKDGLCLRVAEPDGTRGHSVACVNPDAPPYSSANSVVSALEQERGSSTVVTGFAPRAATSVTLTVRGGGQVTAPVTKLASDLPGAARLAVFAADVPGGAEVQQVAAEGADGSTLAVSR